MRKKDFINLIEKYLKNETNLEENKLLFFYLNHFQNKKDWDELEMGDKNGIKENIYNRLLLSSINDDQEHLSSSRFERFKRILIYTTSIASIILLVLFIVSISNTENDYTKITTGIRESKKVTLPDNTTIWLGAQSEIRYPNSFSKLNRNIKFKGVGYFEVFHDSLHPFTIEGDNFQTIVKGTSFNLKTNDSTAEVVLINGKIEIKAIDKAITLHPNEKANFVKKSHALFNQKDKNAINYSHRKEGLFIYKGELLGDALDELENYFGVKIIRNNEINTYSFFGEFKNTQPLDEILKLISVSINGKYQSASNNTYTLNLITNH